MNRSRGNSVPDGPPAHALKTAFMQALKQAATCIYARLELAYLAASQPQETSVSERSTLPWPAPVKRKP